MSTDYMLIHVYETLIKSLGPQQWWPGETALEIMVGAILVQNTAWRNVERAIENLYEAGVMSADSLNTIHDHDLAELIRPAGYFRLKAGRLRNLIDFLFAEYDGSLEAMFATDTQTLRQQLLAIKGVGPETADSILLYAGEKPSFVVDTYTHRILARHGWIEYEADYHQIQEHFTSSLPQDVALYNEYHALLVNVGHHYCKKKAPQCAGCPLEALLPEGRIVEPFA